MISIVVAMTENNVIGLDGGMPWHMSNDLRRFKKITMGHHILMGRRTYESIGRPLPGRTSVVISRTAEYGDPQVKVARSLDEAFEIASADDETFVTGGAEIFRLAIPHADRLYLTRIHCSLEGDTFFPTIAWDDWRLKESESYTADERNQYDFSFETYERIRNA